MIYEKSPGVLVDGFPHHFKRRGFEELEMFLDQKEVVPLRDVARGRLEYGVVGMRHDVDHSIDHALKFARWEATRGWRATYYVLHNAWYYDRSPEFEAKLLELRSLGHEVGLHVNTIIVMDETGVTPPAFDEQADLLRAELAYLRSVCDRIESTGHGDVEPVYLDGEPLEIVGTAAHGDHRRHIYNVSNLDLWADEGTGGPYNPADFELEYEAYHLKRATTYVSDSGAQWNLPLQHHPDKPTSMLIHPCHWDIDRQLELAMNNEHRPPA